MSVLDKPFDWSKLDALLQRGATKLACSEILEVSEATIDRYIRAKHDLNFTQYREKKLQKTIIKLIEKAVDKALAGDNTMLIWTMKNLAGWSDKTETSITELKPVQLNYALKQAKEIINVAAEKDVKEIEENKDE